MLFKQSTRHLALAARISSPVRSAIPRRPFTSTTAQFTSEQPSAYRQGMSNYKTFAGAFGKVFLGAVLTYQIIYWTWLKLETDESRLEKNEEMASLEKKARELAAAQK
ncbi:uncharacterized protein N7496_011046 [Penicillium cataractarum]|uniref:Uncharacterized protein n=1 Tax=Penicillium cataractarum TaxID=2100454 RepID=A0A9W9RJE7_9EURO|nr:uncharacterized protein N7496_011046 [Penicillium cataractarum]KAJ5358633.1 hypothetical protein N7496_011046 [Penicillium cataractarum]